MSAELVAQRRRLVDEWNAWRGRVMSEGGGSAEGKKKGRKEEEKEEIAVWVDEVVEQVEEEVV